MTAPLLVLGSRGFTGRHLAERLRGKGLRVVGVDTSPAEHKDDIQADLSMPGEVLAIMRTVAPSGLFLLAGLVGEPVDPEGRRRMLAANVDLTLTVLEAALATSRPRVLITSSCAVYGLPGRPDGTVREDDPCRPVTFYGATKSAQESIALAVGRQTGLHVVVTRAFNLFGPGEGTASLVGSIVAQVATGGDRVRLGNTEPARDFVDVRDAVAAYDLVMAAASPGEVINVGTGQAKSVLEVVNTVIAISGRPVRVERDEARVRAVDIPVIRADNTRLLGLGWRPIRAFEDSVRDMLRARGI